MRLRHQDRFRRLSGVSLLTLGLLSGCTVPARDLGALSPGNVSELAAKRPSHPFPYGLGGQLGTVPKMVVVPAGGLAMALPRSIDLRSGCSAIGNQGQTNSCSAFATVDGLAEYLVRKQGHAEDFAPGFIWNLVRQATNQANDNVGIDYRDAMKAIATTGLVRETAFPFPSMALQDDPRSLLSFMTKVPPAALLAEAKQHRPFANMQVVPDAQAMKQQVAAGLPVVFGIMAFQSIEATNGPIPLPKKGEAQLGSHIILCVGYDDDAKRFIIRNSWGPGWGDHGYGYLPYDYVRDGWVHLGATAKI